MIKKIINFLFSKISKIEVGKTYVFFHVSNPKYRDLIYVLGLIPKVGDSYKLHYEEFEKGELEPRIFVSLTNDYDSTYDDDRYMIILNQAEFEFLDFKEDKEVKNAFYTIKPISIENLFLIHEGDGKSEDFNGFCNKLGSKIFNLRLTKSIYA